MAESAGSKPFLLPLSWIYSCGRRLHQGMYDSGVIRRKRLPRPVICVGNLTVGGTGKTPFIIGLDQELRAAGLRTVILSRGYGASPPPRKPRVISTEDRIEVLDAAEAGDEPLLIARSRPGTPVVICPDRAAAGAEAEARFAPDLFLLDDGFQHEAVEKDISFVLWDLQDIPSKSHQLPAGRLRESLRGLGRATAVILTHAEAVSAGELPTRVERVAREIEAAVPGVPVFLASTRFEGFVTLEEFAGFSTGGPQEAVAEPPGGKLMLVSGLARPGSFRSVVESTGGEVVEHMAFPDHHRYGVPDFARIREKSRNCGASAVITTAKDAVKMAGLPRGDGFPPVFVALIRMLVPDAEGGDGSTGWREFLRAKLEDEGLKPLKMNILKQSEKAND